MADLVDILGDALNQLSQRTIGVDFNRLDRLEQAEKGIQQQAETIKGIIDYARRGGASPSTMQGGFGGLLQQQPQQQRRPSSFAAPGASSTVTAPNLAEQPPVATVPQPKTQTRPSKPSPLAGMRQRRQQEAQAVHPLQRRGGQQQSGVTVTPQQPRQQQRPQRQSTPTGILGRPSSQPPGFVPFEELARTPSPGIDIRTDGTLDGTSVVIEQGQIELGKPITSVMDGQVVEVVVARDVNSGKEAIYSVTPQAETLQARELISSLTQLPIDHPLVAFQAPIYNNLTPEAQKIAREQWANGNLRAAIPPGRTVGPGAHGPTQPSASAQQGQGTAGSRLVQQVLQQQGTPTWLQRAMSKPGIKNPDGSISTIRSMTATDESGRGLLFPTIREIDGKLKVLSPDAAFRMAQQKGDFLVFASEAEADHFSRQLSQSGLLGAQGLGQGQQEAPTQGQGTFQRGVPAAQQGGATVGLPGGGTATVEQITQAAREIIAERGGVAPPNPELAQMVAQQLGQGQQEAPTQGQDVTAGVAGAPQSSGSGPGFLSQQAQEREMQRRVRFEEERFKLKFEDKKIEGAARDKIILGSFGGVIDKFQAIKNPTGVASSAIRNMIRQSALMSTALEALDISHMDTDDFKSMAATLEYINPDVLSTFGRVTQEEIDAVVAMNSLVRDLRGLTGEARPSDFDALRALKSLGLEFGTTPGRAMSQMIATYNQIATEYDRKLEMIRPSFRQNYGLGAFPTREVPPEFRAPSQASELQGRSEQRRGGVQQRFKRQSDRGGTILGPNEAVGVPLE